MQNINLTKSIKFDDKVDELLVISIDDEIEKINDKDGYRLEGNVIVAGNVKILENEVQFNEKIAIDVFLGLNEINNIDELKIIVKDFTYDIKECDLCINISLDILGLRDINESFLPEEDDEDIEEIIDYTERLELPDIKEEKIIENIHVDENKKSNNLLDSVFSKRKFLSEVSWRLHCVRGETTYEEIANIYKVDVEKMKKLNNNEDIMDGKLVFLPLK